MIRITAELVPYGEDRLATKIGQVIIGNISRKGRFSEMADYSVTITEERRVAPGNQPPFYPEEARETVLHSTRVYDFKRLEGGVWDLLREALNADLAQQKKAA